MPQSFDLYSSFNEYITRHLNIGTQKISAPNPLVFCVLHSSNGEVIAQGHTQQAGGPHAEVMALRAAQAAGVDTRGATAYVTLEPCSHHGRRRSVLGPSSQAT